MCLAKLYIPSTLNIDLILWHTQLIVCAENVKTWFKSWVLPFTFQAYILPHTLNCMCVSLFKGYGALVLRLTDEVVEALFVTYDLWK